MHSFPEGGSRRKLRHFGDPPGRGGVACGTRGYYETRLKFGLAGSYYLYPESQFRFVEVGITMQQGTLHFISGRLAAGKTTLARELAAEYHAVLISEDVWLSKLSDGISSFDDYLKWSRRCRSVMGPLIMDMLRAGVCVVLDFAGNRVTERAWARNLSEGAGSSHILHFLDVGEEECLRRLLVRNDRKPEGLYFASTTEAEFRAICKYFQVPTPEEGLNITTHGNGSALSHQIEHRDGMHDPKS